MSANLDVLNKIEIIEQDIIITISNNNGFKFSGKRWLTGIGPKSEELVLYLFNLELSKKGGEQTSIGNLFRMRICG